MAGVPQAGGRLLIPHSLYTIFFLSRTTTLLCFPIDWVIQVHNRSGALQKIHSCWPVTSLHLNNSTLLYFSWFLITYFLLPFSACTQELSNFYSSTAKSVIDNCLFFLCNCLCNSEVLVWVLQHQPKLILFTIYNHTTSVYNSTK